MVFEWRYFVEVQCPWCGEEVRLDQTICPECKHEVLPEHLSGKDGEDGLVEGEKHQGEEKSVIASIEMDYACTKCGHDECAVNEVAMTGAGLSKLLDIQHHHYFFVSCLACGSVDIYDPAVLEGRKRGEMGTTLDMFL